LSPAPGDARPFFFTSDPEVLGDLAKQNMATFLALATTTINGPLAVEPKARLTGPKYHPLWRQISGAWVNTHGNPGTVAVCLETAWNTPHSITENYRDVAAGSGRRWWGICGNSGARRGPQSRGPHSPCAAETAATEPHAALRGALPHRGLCGPRDCADHSSGLRQQMNSPGRSCALTGLSAM
jgi:hypothetical protein